MFKTSEKYYMKKLVKIFHVNSELNFSIQIVKWWELRRFVFNAFNAFALFIGLFAVYISMPSLLNFFLLPFVILYGIVINVVYLLGWIILVIIRITWKDLNMAIITSVLFIFFNVFSTFITLSFCLIYLLINIP